MLCFPKPVKEKPVGYSFSLICGYLIHVQACSMCRLGLKGLIVKKMPQIYFCLVSVVDIPQSLSAKISVRLDVAKDF